MEGTAGRQGSAPNYRAATLPFRRPSSARPACGAAACTGLERTQSAAGQRPPTPRRDCSGGGGGNSAGRAGKGGRGWKAPWAWAMGHDVRQRQARRGGEGQRSAASLPTTRLPARRHAHHSPAPAIWCAARPSRNCARPGKSQRHLADNSSARSQRDPAICGRWGSALRARAHWPAALKCGAPGLSGGSYPFAGRACQSLPPSPASPAETRRSTQQTLRAGSARSERVRPSITVPPYLVMPAGARPARGL